MLENLFDNTIEEAVPMPEYPARSKVELMPAVYCMAGRNGLDAAAVFDLLTRLVNRSLVQIEHNGGDGRYRLLETLRQFARDRLSSRKYARSAG